MADKITNSFSLNSNSTDDKSLSRLNFLLYILITCTCLYGFLAIYKNTDDIKQSQEYVRSIVTLPSVYQLGGHTNTNIVSVITNITKEPSTIKFNEKLFTVEKSYSRGDIVFIKYFNVYGIVKDKSSGDYYNIVYRDNIHKLNDIDLPVDFLLRPSLDSLTPFIFTP